MSRNWQISLSLVSVYTLILIKFVLQWQSQYSDESNDSHLRSRVTQLESSLPQNLSVVFVVGPPDGSTREIVENYILVSKIATNVFEVPPEHVECGTRIQQKFYKLNKWLLQNGLSKSEDHSRKASWTFYHSFTDVAARNHPLYISGFQKPARDLVKSLSRRVNVRKHLLLELPWLSLTLNHWLPLIKEIGGKSRCIITRYTTATEYVKAFQILQGRYLLSADEIYRIGAVWLKRAKLACRSFATATFYVNGNFKFSRELPHIPSHGAVDDILRSLLSRNLVAESAPIYIFENHAASSSGDLLDNLICKIIESRSSHNTTEDWPQLEHITDSAYATVITSNNMFYIYGALVLARSIALQDASRDRIAIVTSEVNEVSVEILTENGWKIKRFPPLAEFWFGTSKCRYRSRGNNHKVRWGRMANKLRLWELEEYERVLYFDTDVVVTGLASSAFENIVLNTPTLELVGEGGTGHPYINAGVLLLRPSRETFKSLLKHAETNPTPGLFPNLVDCTEQALINAYFMKLSRKRPISRSPSALSDDREKLLHARYAVFSTHSSCCFCIGRPDVFRDYHNNSPLAVHFVRLDICTKPWKFANKAYGGELLESIRQAATTNFALELNKLHHIRTLVKTGAEGHLARMAAEIDAKICDFSPYDIWISLLHISVPQSRRDLKMID